MQELGGEDVAKKIEKRRKRRAEEGGEEAVEDDPLKKQVIPIRAMSVTLAMERA